MNAFKFDKIDSGESYNPLIGNSITEEMTKDIDNLCKQLYQSNRSFNTKDTFEKLINCIIGEKRILYYQVTVEVYDCYKNNPITVVDGLMNNFAANIIELIEYTNSEEVKNRIDYCKSNAEKQNELKALESSKKVLYKLWDHVNLANHQYVQLKQSDEEFQLKFNERFEKSFEESSKLKLNEFSKEMNAQLLTLVGIFTALAFMIFGSITGLVNIFTNTGISVLKLMILGCVWGIAVLNLVFVFLFCVGKMTKTKFASTDVPNASIWKKYPIVWWSDLVIGSILLLTMWIYYLKNRDGLAVIDHLLQAYPKRSVAIGSLIVVLIIGIACNTLMWLIHRED